MRIVHLLSCEGPWGDAVAALYLAQQQRSMGHDVTMLIKNGPLTHRFIERAEQARVPARVLDDVDLNSSVAARVYVFRLLRHLVRLRPRIVHLHERGLTSKISDIVPARLCLSRKVFSTMQFFGEFLGSPETVAADQRRWVAASKYVTAVIAPSAKSAAVQRAAGIPEDKIRVIHNVVDTTRIRVASGAAVRTELGLADDDVLVLFLARLDDVKHPLTTIEAFARILPRFPTARLAIAGTGSLFDACAARIIELNLQESARLLGFRTDVGELLQAADIFHSPSEAEAFPIAILEAIASGTPVITTNIAPMMGEVLPADGGTFHELDDVAGAARAMESLAGDPALRKSLAASATAFATAHYLPEKLARDHLALYRGQLERRARVHGT